MSTQVSRTRSSFPLGLVLLTTLSLAGCGSSESGDDEGGNIECLAADAPQVFFDVRSEAEVTAPAAEHWLRLPFPFETRRFATGNVDISDFPNPDDEPTLRSYTYEVEDEINGFGTNSPAHFRFNVELDETSLPILASSAMGATGVIQIIDIDTQSPEYGTRRPVRHEYFAVGGKYVPNRSLSVAPEWGFPLRQSTTYAVIITTDLKDADGKALVQPDFLRYAFGDGTAEGCLDETLSTEDRTDAADAFAPLTAWATDTEFDTTKIAVATVFTTQSITGQLQAIYDDIYDELDVPSVNADSWRDFSEGEEAAIFHTNRSFEWNSTETVEYWVMEGTYASPNYQSGELPYAQTKDGGAFNFVDGDPEPDHFETLRFVLTIPKTAPTGTCYPIVEYAHGTGGSAQGIRGSKAGRHAARGLASIALDQPLHGTRWANSDNGDLVSLYSFNVFNPAAARAMFRQSAVDTFYLTRLIKEGALVVPADKSPTGSPICFDRNNISFFGHSHGGLSGALAAAFESNINAYMLSGAGGGLSITMFEREDSSINAQEAMELVLLPAEGEIFTEQHPVVGMVQMLAEITDPINYSPYWSHLEGHSTPRSVFLTSGEFDAQTPHRTATSMAVAAHIPIVEPIAVDVPSYALSDITPVAAPLSGNKGGVTTGFIQWTNGDGQNDADHFVIFNRDEAINASQRFLQSAAFESTPKIERDTEADVK